MTVCLPLELMQHRSTSTVVSYRLDESRRGRAAGDYLCWMKRTEQVIYELRELSQVDFGSDLGINLMGKNARH